MNDETEFWAECDMRARRRATFVGWAIGTAIALAVYAIVTAW